MTPRATGLLEHLRTRLDHPSLRELAASTGLTLRAVRQAVGELECAGHIERPPARRGQSRPITVLDEPRPPAEVIELGAVTDEPAWECFDEAASLEERELLEAWRAAFHSLRRGDKDAAACREARAMLAVIRPERWATSRGHAGRPPGAASAPDRRRRQPTMNPRR